MSALAEKFTARHKELDLALAREHTDDDVASTLAACHFGLGIRMLVELGWSAEDVVDVAGTIAQKVAADLPEEN